MQVAVLRLNFTGSSARASLYRSPDGKVQQFLLLRDRSPGRKYAGR